MVKLKNYNVGMKHFVLLLTFISLISCSSHQYYVTKIEGSMVHFNSGVLHYVCSDIFWNMAKKETFRKACKLAEQEHYKLYNNTSITY